MDDYYNNRPQQVPGAQKKRTSLYDVDASKAEGVEVKHYLTCSFNTQTKQLLTYLLTYLLTHLFIHLFIHSLICMLINNSLCIHSLTD